MADYVTLSEVMDDLGDLGTDYNSQLQKYITRASRTIDRLTGRPFGFGLLQGQTMYLDGPGERTGHGTLSGVMYGPGERILFVPDLQAVTAVGVKVGGSWAVSYTSVPLTDIFLEPSDRTPGFPALWIELNDYPHSQVVRFDTGKQTVQITGDWGWYAVPDEIKDVCLEIVVHRFKMRGSGDEDKTGADNLAVASIPRGLSRASREIIAAYTYHRRVYA